MKESRRVLVALGAGLVLGLTIASRHNRTLVGVVDAVAPAGALWVNAIRMTIIPLVVSLVITGVASTSNVGAISRIGGRTLLVFFGMLAGATTLAIPLGIAAFSWLSRLVTVRRGFRPALPRPRRPSPPFQSGRLVELGSVVDSHQSHCRHCQWRDAAAGRLHPGIRNRVDVGVEARRVGEVVAEQFPGERVNHASEPCSRKRLATARTDSLVEHLALLVVEHRDRQAPGALARDAPVGPRFEHAARCGAGPTRGRSPIFSASPRIAPVAERRLAFALDCREGERLVHRDEPLLGRAEDDRRLAPPVVRVAVRDLLLGEEHAEVASASATMSGLPSHTVLPRRNSGTVSSNRPLARTGL